MARKVKAMPERDPVSKYPWEKWLDGGVWELTPGKDFKCEIDSMRQQVYQAARDSGRSATTRVNDGHLYIQVSAAKAKTRKK